MKKKMKEQTINYKDLKPEEKLMYVDMLSDYYNQFQAKRAVLLESLDEEMMSLNILPF